MQISAGNNQKEISQDQFFQSNDNNQKVDLSINRFNIQQEIKYSAFSPQNLAQGQIVVPFDMDTQQNTNQFLQLLSEADEDYKLKFFRSTLCLWLVWGCTIFLILIFNLGNIDRYCSRIERLIEFGSLFVGLLIVSLLKNRIEKKCVSLDLIKSEYIDKILFVIIAVASGFFHVNLIAIIECQLVGNISYNSNYNYKLEKEILYVGILVHLSILISIFFIFVITFIQQKIDPKQYFIISLIISLFLGIMYSAASLKIEVIPITLIFIIFSLYGTIVVLSGQQISNGKYSLDKKQKYMGAVLQYLNLFWLCF